MPRRHRTRIFATVAVLGGALVATAVLGRGGHVVAAPQVIPANTVPPVITGEPVVDSTLTASTGTWSGTTPITYSYVWQRCDANGGSCTAVTGATTPSYPLETVDAGTSLRVVVTATNADGSVSATSVPTAVIRRTSVTGCPPVQQAGPIDVSTINAPERLLIDRQTIAPRVVRGRHSGS